MTKEHLIGTYKYQNESPITVRRLIDLLIDHCSRHPENGNDEVIIRKDGKRVDNCELNAKKPERTFGVLFG